jgi:hypothetical protein
MMLILFYFEYRVDIFKTFGSVIYVKHDSKPSAPLVEDVKVLCAKLRICDFSSNWKSSVNVKQE